MPLFVRLVLYSAGFFLGTEQTASGGRWWHGTNMSADGTKLAACLYYGHIYTSNNSGSTWTENSSAPWACWIRMASSDDGQKIYAGNASTGKMWASTDGGNNWFVKTNSYGSGYGIGISSDGVTLVIGYYGGNIYTSADSGDNWTERPAAGSRYWYCFASSSDGVKIASVVADGDLYTSADSGAIWTIRSSAGTRAWRSIASSDNGVYLAAAAQNSYIYTSTDSGANWTAQTGSGIKNWYSIASSSDGKRLVAADCGGYIYTSNDYGISWTAQTGAGQRSWENVSISAAGTKILAVARWKKNVFYGEF